jgi:hypothetical protein
VETEAAWLMVSRDSLKRTETGQWLSFRLLR